MKLMLLRDITKTMGYLLLWHHIFPISSNIYIPFFNLIVLLNHLFGLCFFLPVPSRTHFSLRFSRSIEKQLMDEAFLRPWNITEQKQEQLTCGAHLMRVPQQPKPFRFSIGSPSMRPSLLEIISALLVLEFHFDLMALSQWSTSHVEMQWPEAPMLSMVISPTTRLEPGASTSWILRIPLRP